MSYADWAYAQFGFVKPHIRRLSTPRFRRWTTLEGEKLCKLWRAYGNSADAAQYLRRERDDVRCALHILDLKEFPSTYDEMMRTRPADYYDALLPPVPPVYSTYTWS